MKNAPERARLLLTAEPAFVYLTTLDNHVKHVSIVSCLTVIGEKLSDVKKGKRHQDVEDPVDPG